MAREFSRAAAASAPDVAPPEPPLSTVRMMVLSSGDRVLFSGRQTGVVATDGRSV